ncbi:regulatory protein [Allocatelliglobosispora scoriae]|uniref:Regulatory protein RecX n=1 Tax=Allocatelliglobosispora scoriae TaxID=643052 RepID=A0A841BXW4_9ACTN|nr:regulatory protein RecX [Allocatelliglobosispora scoriae]MBB5872328.1 regulatory protein [Allocatelliglobosispora scoriae]
MAGRRARTGRGWDASPRRASSRAPGGGPPEDESGSAEAPLGPRSRRAERAAEPPAPLTPREEGERAREICLRQLAVRPRTRSELDTALRKRGIGEETIAEVLDRYDEVGIIDDAAFARAWVSSRHYGKGLAGRALAQELRRRGVEQDLITEAVSEIDSETEAATALDLARRKLRSLHGDPQSVFRRLVGALARKGYSGGVAVGAAKQAFAERSAEDAELAEAIDPDSVTED